MSKQLRNRRFISLIIVLMLVLSVTGCTQQTSAPQVEKNTEGSAAPVEEKISFKPGTYTAEGKGNGGPITVEVKFTEDTIEDVTVKNHTETAGISDPAIEKIPQNIVNAQTVKVDVVSGATNTSNGIIAAVSDCVKQAGADPDKLAEAEKKAGEDEEYTTDIVVVGAGAAGLVAAMDGSRAGKNVIILEKGSNINCSNFSHIGGSAAVNSKLQQEAGVDFTVEELFNHMMEYSHWSVNAPLVKNCLEVSGSIIDDFTDLGMSLFVADDRYDVGFKDVHVYTDPDKASYLEKEIIKNGGKFMYETAGEKLILENNNVVGVEARKTDGTFVTVKAKAVFVATGGYLANKEMMKKYLGDVNTTNLGSTLNTGDGINMVLEAGGTTDRNYAVSLNDITGFNKKVPNYLETIFTPDKNFALDFAFCGGLLVNTHGDRFFNEFKLANDPLAGGGEATLRAGKYYAIVDENTVKSLTEQSIYQFMGEPKIWSAGKYMFNTPMTKIENDINTAISEGWGFKGDSIQAIADKFGLENLSETVKNYNTMCESGYDSQLYKPTEFMNSIGEGPYYIFEYEPSSWCTFGGVKVDDQLRALTGQNEIIQGLYVGGSDAGSLYSSPYYNIGGTSSGLALMSGRIAAKSMVEYVDAKN